MTSYKINEEKMFADISDGIAIIINGESGIYYGMNGFGTAVFENLVKGAPVDVIVNELKKIPNIPNDIEARFQVFLQAILDKELLIPSDEVFTGEIFINFDAATEEFALNVSEYNDAQELLLADPIHEVKEETGWLPEKDSLNPDAEDVLRREMKMEE